ncbi:hypothetical protein CWE27_31990 [Streptomyces sp. EAG2]|nr:hypothetical protein CWE27_31990 [Streptomyces sp. EAG2]
MWASSPQAGIGTSTAERDGRGGAAVVLRAGESPAHGEGRQRFERGGGCNAERCTGERRCPAGTGPAGASTAGIGDADQTSPLGGG